MEACEIVIADTGVLVASIDESDHWHKWVLEQTRMLSLPMLTCEPVLTETCFITGKHPRAIRQLHAWVEAGCLRVDPGSQRSVAQALELMDTYSNVPMSYADACLVCMVEARPRSRVFTLDSDFRIYRQRSRRVIPLIAPFV